MIIGDLEWRDDVVQGVTLAEAEAYAASLGNGWRVPTLDELLSIVDPAKYDPACSVFPDCPAVETWTVTRWSGSPLVAYVVNFFDGDGDSAVSVNNLLTVRAVRTVA